MTDREFLRAVRERARLSDDRAAAMAASTLIADLVARLSWGLKQDLAAALPPKFRRLALAAPNTGLRYAPPSAFIRELAEQLWLTPPEAENIARAVASVLAELLPPDDLRDLRAELNRTYDAIFA